MMTSRVVTKMVTPRERELMKEIESLKQQLRGIHASYEDAMRGWSEAIGSNYCVKR